MSGRLAFGELRGFVQAHDHAVAINAATPSLSSERSFAPNQARSRLVSDPYSTTLPPGALPIAVVRLDSAGNIVSLHSDMRGSDRSSRSLLGRNCLDICAEVETAGSSKVFAKNLKQLLRGRLHEFQCVHIDGGRTLQLHSISVGGAEPVLVIVQDITEFLQAKEALADATRRVALVREEERRSIAADLHDTTCQHLVAIDFGLSALERGGPNTGVFADMRRGLSEVFKQIRTLSYLAYPQALVSEGLIPSLKELARGYRLRAGVAVNLSVRGQLEALPLKVKRAVLHIVKEALINAHRHAKATKIWVSVTLGRRGLTLRVADDGPRAALKDFTPGIGLRGMGARAAQLGGRLSVGPGPSGAVVSAFFPASSLGAEHSVGVDPPSCADPCRGDACRP
jgi:signal transduction histidine kinase